MEASVAEEVGKEEKTRELTSYEKMSPAMKKLWEERLFNMVKQRSSLLVGDAVLTWAFLLWMGLASLVGLLSLYDPMRFPIYREICFSLAAFFVYYFIIGFVRRQTERNLVAFSAQHPDPDYHKSVEFRQKRPYHKDDDPPMARFAFRLRTLFGLPRRGLAQISVVLFQFLAVLGYVYNYTYYVLYQGALGPENFASLFWAIHLTVNGGGILILFKNYGFLIDTNRLLATIEGLAGSILGHAHATVKIEKNGQKPCDEKSGGKEKK